MPHIEIRDYAGQTRILDSSNPQTIAQWLLEQCSELTNVNMSLGPIQLSIYPRYTLSPEGGRPEPDWKAGSRALPVDKEGLYSLMNWLTAWERARELAQPPEAPSVTSE